MQARRLGRLAVGWSILIDCQPIYALYVLLFADAGLSGAQISGLFILWSGVGLLAELPSGAIADRYSRRGAVVASALLQAAGFSLWITVPGYFAFAAGFVVWGVGGALASGAFEALVYEGLAQVGAQDQYVRINGRIYAGVLLVQIPATALAALLFTWGGYPLVGWVSVAICLAATLLALRLPQPVRPASGDRGPTTPGHGYFRTLGLGLAEAVGQPSVRMIVIAVALVTGLDALEEYFPLMARGWGIPTGVVPLAVLTLPLAGAAGAALGGRAGRLSARSLTALLMGGLIVLAAMAVIAMPLGLLGVAVFYGLHQLVLVVMGARLQERITGDSRATVTSVASLAAELGSIALFAAWAFDGLLTVALAWLGAAALLPRLLKKRA